MNKILTTWYAILIVFVSIQHIHAQNNSAEITLIVRDTEVKQHKWMAPIYLEIEATNKSNVDIEIAWSNQIFLPIISAYSTTDKEQTRYNMTLTRYGKQQLSDSVIAGNSTKILKPGETVSKKVHINRVYDMSATTNCKVKASLNYVDAKGKLKKAISDEITINIEVYKKQDMHNSDWP